LLFIIPTFIVFQIIALIIFISLAVPEIFDTYIEFFSFEKILKAFLFGLFIIVLINVLPILTLFRDNIFTVSFILGVNLFHFILFNSVESYTTSMFLKHIIISTMAILLSIALAYIVQPLVVLASFKVSKDEDTVKNSTNSKHYNRKFS